VPSRLWVAANSLRVIEQAAALPGLLEAAGRLDESELRQLLLELVGAGGGLHPTRENLLRRDLHYVSLVFSVEHRFNGALGADCVNRRRYRTGCWSCGRKIPTEPTRTFSARSGSSPARGRVRVFWSVNTLPEDHRKPPRGRARKPDVRSKRCGCRGRVLAANEPPRRSAPTRVLLSGTVVG